MNVSLTLDHLGERAESIQHAEQALTIYEQIEDPRAADVRAQLAEWREQTDTRNSGKLSRTIPNHCYTPPQPSRGNRPSNQGC